MIIKFQNLKTEYEYLIALETQLKSFNKVIDSLQEAKDNKSVLSLQLEQLKNEELKIVYDENTHMLLKKELEEIVRKKMI